MLGDITYNNNKAWQYLDSFSLYDLEGSLEELEIKLAQMKVTYLNHPLDVTATYIDGCGDQGITNKTTKTVAFTRIFLDVRCNGYDDEKSLCLIGERDILPEEQLVLDARRKVSFDTLKEQKKQQIERLTNELNAMESKN